MSAREVQASVFFKSVDGEDRVSLRSKGTVDVREVAVAFGGGGHRNAAGFTPKRPIAALRDEIITRVVEALRAAQPG